jgi:selenide,water dikinase
MRSLPRPDHPDLLVGYESSDDAGIFRLSGDLALVQTVDFITPIVDDPRLFGMIAAANSLSDVYAMGGKPLTVLNILCFPSDDLPLETATAILRGGYDKTVEAGAVLVGGHSLKDKELKYGLSVTGTIHPGRVLTNAGARPGDRIILTKPVGTGLVATAVKAGQATPAAAAAMALSASTLNRVAAEAMAAADVHACTDITGFGLGGHLLEVARASGVAIRLSTEVLPLLPGVKDYASMGLIPAGSYANRKFCRELYEMDKDTLPLYEDIIFDPQTSGGLVIFAAPAAAGAILDSLHRRGVGDAAMIGDVTGPNRCGRLIISR